LFQNQFNGANCHVFENATFQAKASEREPIIFVIDITVPPNFKYSLDSYH